MNTARIAASSGVAAVGFPVVAKASPAAARKTVTLLAAVSLALGLFTGPAAALAGPEDSVHNLYDTLLSTMKDGRTLGQSGRFARIKPVILRLFDLSRMTRLAVGASWASLSPAQQQQVETAFGDYISATYADRFDSYSGQQLEVTRRQSSGVDVLVGTRIVKPGGEPVGIAYLMHQNDGAWQIADVYLDGAISQLATQRSEFGAILRREGFDGLVTTLNRKVNLLTGNVARAW